MARRPGGRPGGSKPNDFVFDFEFDLFTVDLEGNERTPIANQSSVFVAEGTRNNQTDVLDITGVRVEPITNYTFDDAIENFTGDFFQLQGFFAFTPVQVPLEVDNLT
ncbi:MAG: hypothetical protein ACRC80_37065, partial [Waterburya sp.]